MPVRVIDKLRDFVTSSSLMAHRTAKGTDSEVKEAFEEGRFSAFKSVLHFLKG